MHVHIQYVFVYGCHVSGNTAWSLRINTGIYELRKNNTMQRMSKSQVNCDVIIVW